MKNFSFAQFVSLLANLGVIAGIVFLAIEVRQNSESLEAQIRTMRHTIRAADYQLPLEHRDFAEALIKKKHGQPLSEYEALILNRSMAMTLLNYQYVYGEYMQGRIRESELPLETWRLDLDGKEQTSGAQYWPDLRAYWEANDYAEFDPGFVQWMNANVVDR